MRDVNHVTACGYLDLSSPVLDVLATPSTFKVLMPFIRNTQPIEAGKEVILKWRPTPKSRLKDKQTRTPSTKSKWQKKKKKRKAMKMGPWRDPRWFGGEPTRKVGLNLHPRWWGNHHPLRNNSLPNTHVDHA